MALYRLPTSTPADIRGIYQLNTTTLENAYMQAHFPQEPRTFVEKVKKAWACFWLNTSIGCWFAGNVAGKGGFDAERASIGKYQSALNALITCLSKAKLNPEWAEFLDMPPENSANEELPALAQAFYQALKERAELVAGDDKMRPETILSQAALLRAGLQEVATRIQQHNADNASGLFKQPQIQPWWNLIVDKVIIEKEYANLYKEISPDELLSTGESPDDYVQHKIGVYYQTFEANPSFASIKDQERIEELTANVKADVRQARGSEFQEKIDLRTQEAYIQERIRKRVSHLEECIGSRWDAFTAQTAALRTEIPEDTAVDLISSYLYPSKHLELMQEKEKGVDILVKTDIQKEIDSLEEFVVERADEATPLESDSEDDSPEIIGSSSLDIWDFDNPSAIL